eukprot:gene1407-12027_t
MSEQHVLLTYSLEKKPAREIDIEVFDPENNVYHKTSQGEASAYYNFQSQKGLDGIYEVVLKVCLSYTGGEKLKMNVHFEIDDPHENRKEVQKVHNINRMKDLIEILNDKEMLVRTELEYLKARETTFRKTTDAISTRVWVFKLLSSVTIIVISLIQVKVQNLWFKKNKIIL